MTSNKLRLTVLVGMPAISMQAEVRGLLGGPLNSKPKANTNIYPVGLTGVDIPNVGSLSF